MIKKTILISETEEKKVNEIISILEEIRNDIIILDFKPKMSLELYESIIAYKPDIVITNENKEDYASTDIIKKIQSNLEIYQPEFIIISNYKHIEKICKEKSIIAYCIEETFKKEDILECVKSIISNIKEFVSKNIKLEKNFNFSKKNMKFVEKFIEESEQFYDKYEYEINLIKQYDLFDKIEKHFWDNPLKSVRNPINDYSFYKDNAYSYKLCFLYQYLIHNL